MKPRGARPLAHVLVVAVALAMPALVHGAPSRDSASGELRIDLDRAATWVAAVPVDADTLESLGLISKKCLAEALECCWTLERHRTHPAAMLARARGLAAETTRPGYHDQARCDSIAFHRASMSYLRVAWLMDRLGIDTRAYRDSIRAVADRLEGAMPGRGYWQRAMIEGYQRYFGLVRGAKPASGPLDSGLVAHRLVLDRYTVDRAYDLTHEVYAVFENPTGYPSRAFSPAERRYLDATLPALTATSVARGDVDLTAELATSMAYLGLRQDLRWRDAIRWLAARQNEDGSWGSYPDIEARRGALAEEMGRLHTTLVVIEALEQAERGRHDAPSSLLPG